MNGQQITLGVETITALVEVGAKIVELINQISTQSADQAQTVWQETSAEFEAAKIRWEAQVKAASTLPNTSSLDSSSPGIPPVSVEKPATSDFAGTVARDEKKIVKAWAP